MRSRGMLVTGLVVLLAVVLVLGGTTRQALAGSPAQEEGNLVRGAMLYDKWYAVLGVDAPKGDHPLWATQSTNTRSGEDTWRCVTCHGWDYQGKDGANREGSSGYTGFPGVYAASERLSEEELFKVVSGGAGEAHDFSAYLDEASRRDLALFLKKGLVDDSQYIDPVSLKVIGGDAPHGKQLFDAQCARCHGEDGNLLPFRIGGSNVGLGELSTVDPWRFLAKTRFGTPGTDMVIGYDLGWQAQDGRDVLAYARSLAKSEVQAPSLGQDGQTGQPKAGPANNIFTGILTAFGAMATGLGFAVLLGGFLVGVIFLVVWVIRGRAK